MCDTVRELTKCLEGPTTGSHKEMLRIIEHALDARGRGLKIAPIMEAIWEATVFTDSDWAGDKDDRRSVSGHMMFLNGALTCWRSKSQKMADLSSSEAEFCACGEAAKEIPFIVQILLFPEITVQLPVQVKVGNIGATFMSENTTSSGRT